MRIDIRVFYPLRSGSIILRTDADWDRDVAPHAVDPQRSIFEFTVETDAAHFYFKPCVRDARALHWSVGNNYLATASAPISRDLYPHFYSPHAGSITAPIAVPPVVPAAHARRIRVYLPPGYDENTLKRYPVLYMHDGANLFFPDEAFAGSAWEVDATLDLLDAMNLVDKVIVVGVYAGDRMNEYTMPGYERYGRELVEGVKPLVDARFRTLPGPADTAVMGSSLGGVVAFHLAWQYPQVFGKAACLSSTFGYRDDFARRVVTEPRRPVQLYLDSGWPRDNYEPTRAMRDLLALRGYEPGRDLLYFAFPHARHDEAAWATRCHLPFQFFFGQHNRARAGT